MLTCIHGLGTLLIQLSGFNIWTIIQVGESAWLGIWLKYNYWNSNLKITSSLCGMLLFLSDLRVDNAWSKLYLLLPLHSDSQSAIAHTGCGLNLTNLLFYVWLVAKRMLKSFVNFVTWDKRIDCAHIYSQVDFNLKMEIAILYCIHVSVYQSTLWICHALFLLPLTLLLKAKYLPCFQTNTENHCLLSCVSRLSDSYVFVFRICMYLITKMCIFVSSLNNVSKIYVTQTYVINYITKC